MKKTVLLLTNLFAAICVGKSAAIDSASDLELKGHFKEAAETLTATIKSASGTEKKDLEFELDRLERIKKDYPYTKEELFEELKKSVKGLTNEEFEQWVKEDRFDSREIDGKRCFMGSSVSNLFFRYPELNPRR